MKASKFKTKVDEAEKVINELVKETNDGPVIIEQKEGSDLVVMTVEQLLEITADEPSRELFASAIGGRGNQAAFGQFEAAIGGRGNQIIIRPATAIGGRGNQIIFDAAIGGQGGLLPSEIVISNASAWDVLQAAIGGRGN